MTSRPNHTRCPRCLDTGYIPFFRVHSVSKADHKYQCGSFASARCSCPVGQDKYQGIRDFDAIPEFKDEPHRNHYQYGQAAMNAETQWLTTVHWPRLYRSLPDGAQKTKLAYAMEHPPKIWE